MKMMKKIYMNDENLADKDIENPIISHKFSRDIMEDYFGVPLNTTIEI